MTTYSPHMVGIIRRIRLSWWICLVLRVRWRRWGIRRGFIIRSCYGMGVGWRILWGYWVRGWGLHHLRRLLRAICLVKASTLPTWAPNLPTTASPRVKTTQAFSSSARWPVATWTKKPTLTIMRPTYPRTSIPPRGWGRYNLTRKTRFSWKKGWRYRWGLGLKVMIHRYTCDITSS